MRISMEKSGAVCNQDELVRQLRELTERVRDMAKRGCAEHEAEWAIWYWVLALGHEVMRTFLSWFGDGDEDAEGVLPCGKQVWRLERRHCKDYPSVFGPFVIERAVYGTREGQKIGFCRKF